MEQELTAQVPGLPCRLFSIAMASVVQRKVMISRFFSGYHSIPPEVLCYIQYSIKIANLQVLLTKYYYKCRIKVIIHWLHSALLCMVGPAANYHTIYWGNIDREDVQGELK